MSEHAGRRTKIARIAEFLRRLAPDEIAIGVSYLSGLTRQGRTGIGWAQSATRKPHTLMQTQI